MSLIELCGQWVAVEHVVRVYVDTNGADLKEYARWVPRVELSTGAVLTGEGNVKRDVADGTALAIVNTLNRALLPNGAFVSAEQIADAKDFLRDRNAVAP